MTTRAVTLLRIKRATGELSFTGWASTSDIDRMGDRVEPKGAQFKLPLPILWAHDPRQPIGTVEDAAVTDHGIRVSFTLVPEVAKAREAAALIAAGALALSIGFQVLDSEPLPNGGRRFKRWAWHELSLVAVPANENARIDPVGKGLVMCDHAEDLPAYVPCMDLEEDYRRALASLPASIRRRALATHSGKATNGTWELRDASGTVLAEVGGPPPKAPRETSQPEAMTSEDIGRFVGLALKEVLGPLKQRIEALEARHKP